MTGMEKAVSPELQKFYQKEQLDRLKGLSLARFLRKNKDQIAGQAQNTGSK